MVGGGGVVGKDRAAGRGCSSQQPQYLTTNIMSTIQRLQIKLFGWLVSSAG